MSADATLQDNYKGVWDTRIGFGTAPALIVIDFMKGYTTEGSPLFAPGVVAAVRESRSLLDSARHAGIPVIHTIVRYQPVHFTDGGIWLKKAPVLKCLVEGNPLSEACDEVKPRDGELVITKQYASAFFGTCLAATLTAARIDTAILIGCSTSGCIRASAIDSVQHGFRTIVVGDCVGDRHPGPHEANLFDINSKYGDVVSSAEVAAYFQQLHRG
ncbi:MAG: N-carbamoylsarcosine amidohydrolase [Pseudorhodoplanes sp.]|uniref:N-carbamoylsarcosine amidohydrolase n=1 Tax=Pseudorhodoplanes sp. TaxID=1934341 RepID=UPI003D0B549A